MSALDESARLHTAVVDFARASVGGGLGGSARAREFEELVLDVARFQAQRCPGHARRLRSASTLDQLRPLPVDCFRFADVFTFDQSTACVTYRTSGTTAALTGRHSMRVTDTYRTLACLGAERALLSEAQAQARIGLPRLLALIPRPGKPSTSSLGDMAHWLMQRWNEPSVRGDELSEACFDDAWLLDDGGVRVDALRAAIDAARDESRAVVLFATSFALVMLIDALARRRLPLPPNSTVVYTGGFKGRTREVSAADLRAQIVDLLEPASVVGEYGMTELSSQLYQGCVAGSALESEFAKHSPDLYLPPPWLKVQALDPRSLEPVENGQRGLAAFIDLGNVDSAVYVVTQDLIELEGQGVRLLGRQARAPARGCSLAAEAIWSAQVTVPSERARPPVHDQIARVVVQQEKSSANPASSGCLYDSALHRVTRLVTAARDLVDERNSAATDLRAAVMRATGLSAEGVELGLRHSLETNPSDAELKALCQGAVPANRVWVVLSANVFVAAHRAIACALAASPDVIVRPSQRDPVLATALHAATGDLFELTTSLRPQPGDHVHAYGSDETMAQLAAQLSPGVTLKAHGSGFGAVVVFEVQDVEGLAHSIVKDAILFEQRGCSSPRLCLLGPDVDAVVLAAALRRAMTEWRSRVPVGDATTHEVADQTWFDAAAAFACSDDVPPDHAEGVHLQRAVAAPMIPPGGRRLVLQPSDEPLAALRTLSTSLTCVAVEGTPEQQEAVAHALPLARVCLPGTMQAAPLDGPLDRRSGQTVNRG